MIARYLGQPAGLRDPGQRLRPRPGHGPRTDIQPPGRGRAGDERLPGHRAAPGPADEPRRGRGCPRCRTSSRPTTRRRTSGASSTRPSRRCPTSPRRSRSSSSTTARGTRRRRSPTSWPPPHPRGPGRPSPDEPRLRRRAPVGLRRLPLRAPRVHRRRSPVPGRRPRPADRARCQDGGADAVVGYRIKRADPLVRTLYARAYRLANRIFFGLTVRDVDCACKLFRRDALDGISVESGGAFFSAELLIKLRAARPAGRRGRRAPLPADRRPPDRREARRSSSAPCATSGRSGCACGPRRGSALGRGEPILRRGPRLRRRRAGSRHRRASAGAAPADSPRPDRSVERVDEVPEHLEARVDDRLAERLERDLAPVVALDAPAARAGLVRAPRRSRRRLVRDRRRGPACSRTSSAARIGPRRPDREGERSRTDGRRPRPSRRRARGRAGRGRSRRRARR